MLAKSRMVHIVRVRRDTLKGKSTPGPVSILANLREESSSIAAMLDRNRLALKVAQNYHTLIDTSSIYCS
jgi:hypothetical protein